MASDQLKKSRKACEMLRDDEFYDVQSDDSDELHILCKLFLLRFATMFAAHSDCWGMTWHLDRKFECQPTSQGKIGHSWFSQTWYLFSRDDACACAYNSAKNRAEMSNSTLQKEQH